jgi:demethylmacrocin O-methyltransferase
MINLDEIGRKNDTDKSSLVHDYLWKYEKYIPFHRDENLKILEIGVLGGASLITWKEWFYNSHIIGLDINSDCSALKEHRIEIEIGSQFDAQFLEYVSKKHGPFDIILDDASHINEHVIFSFEKLFPYVKSKGIYIVEDACTSYWQEWGGSLKGPNTMIEYFKNKIDDINFSGELLEDTNPFQRKDSLLREQLNSKGYQSIGFEIESMNFLNSIIMITRR